MDSHLQSLIDKIKTDGVAEGERQAKALLTEAEGKAARIVADAEKQAGEIVDRAKLDAARAEDAGRKALEQAGRNLVLGIERTLQDLFARLLKEQIQTALTPETLARILEQIVSRWQPGKDLVVELSQQDAEALSKGLVANLRKKAAGGLTLRPVDRVDAGFTIGEKDGNVYYDFTHAGIAENLSQYLNPTLGEILKKGIH